jgi:hypothetical protein
MTYHLPNTNEQPITPDNDEHAAALVARGWVEMPAPEPGPPEPISEVQMWALREACMISGYTSQIESAIAALPDPEKSIAENRWNHKPNIRRVDPIIEALAAILEWPPSTVDALFARSHQIQNTTI